MYSSGNTNDAEKLILQYDGNLLIYNNDNQPLWSTATNRKCITSKNKPLFQIAQTKDIDVIVIYLLLLPVARDSFKNFTTFTGNILTCPSQKLIS